MTRYQVQGAIALCMLALEAVFASLAGYWLAMGSGYTALVCAAGAAMFYGGAYIIVAED